MPKYENIGWYSKPITRSTRNEKNQHIINHINMKIFVYCGLTNWYRTLTGTGTGIKEQYERK